MQQIIEVEHCGNDHLEPIYSICENPIHGFPYCVFTTDYYSIFYR